MHRRCLLRAAGISMCVLLFIASKLTLWLRLKRYLQQENLHKWILRRMLENMQEILSHSWLTDSLTAWMAEWMNEWMDRFVIKTGFVQFMKTG